MGQRWSSVKLEEKQIWKRRDSAPGNNRRPAAVRLVERAAPFTWTVESGSYSEERGFEPNGKRTVMTETVVKNNYDPVPAAIRSGLANHKSPFGPGVG